MAASKMSVVNDSAKRAIALMQKYKWVYNKKRRTETISHSTPATPPLDVSVLFQGNSDEND